MVMNPLEIKKAGSLLLKNHGSSFLKKKVLYQNKHYYCSNKQSFNV